MSSGIIPQSDNSSENLAFKEHGFFIGAKVSSSGTTYTIQDISMKDGSEYVGLKTIGFEIGDGKTPDLNGIPTTIKMNEFIRNFNLESGQALPKTLTPGNRDIISKARELFHNLFK